MMNSKVLAQTLMKLTQSQNSGISVAHFFDYLQQKNLLALLPQIKKHILRTEKASSASETLVITTKHDLSEREVKDIISLVGADSSVHVELMKDESIVGGFSATYAGNIYDGSLRNQITQLRNRLTR